MLSTDSTTERLEVTFTSDVSVTYAGFDMTYELYASYAESKTIPCPGPSICSYNGACQSGVCACLSGYVGEDCSNPIICPHDLTDCGTSCDPVCFLGQSDVIAVSQFGDDTQGTGEIMDTSSEGTSSKAVQSVRRALEIVNANQIILIYPGTFTGQPNCNVSVTTQAVTIRGLRGPSLTSLNCALQLNAIVVSSAQLVQIVDLTILNAKGTNGSAIKTVDSSVTISGATITNSSASQYGGGIYALRSNITLTNSTITNCKASKAGGIFADTSAIILKGSYVSNCLASDGAGMYICGISSVFAIRNSSIEQNVASGRGGGIFASGSVGFNSLVIQTNRAMIGGGLAIEFGVVTSTNVQFTSNKAWIDGGGVAVLSQATLTAITSTISSNQALRNGGGLYITSNETITFDSASTITNCSAGNAR